MTTPDGLTAESEALLRDILRHVVVHGPGGVTVHDGDLRDALAAIEAAALARHVRETGCEVVADTDLLSMAASMVRGDGVCEKPHRDGEANPHYHFDVVHELGNRLANIRRRRLVRETGCDGLREALRRLIDAIETTGLHEHDDGRGGVDLCIPISGIRGVMNDACEAAGHEFLHPEDVPPFCRWCGAALAPTVAACAREGCGHEERHHRVDPDDIPWCWKDCPCPGYLTPSPATEAER